MQAPRRWRQILRSLTRWATGRTGCSFPTLTLVARATTVWMALLRLPVAAYAVRCGSRRISGILWRTSGCRSPFMRIGVKAAGPMIISVTVAPSLVPSPTDVVPGLRASRGAGGVCTLRFYRPLRCTSSAPMSTRLLATVEPCSAVPAIATAASRRLKQASVPCFVQSASSGGISGRIWSGNSDAAYAR